MLRTNLLRARTGTHQHPDTPTYPREPFPPSLPSGGRGGGRGATGGGGGGVERSGRLRDVGEKECYSGYYED